MMRSPGVEANLDNHSACRADLSAWSLQKEPQARSTWGVWSLISHLASRGPRRPGGVGGLGVAVRSWPLHQSLNNSSAN